MTLLVQAGLALAGQEPRQGDEAETFQAELTRTGKERLGSKASDEQRVDNCKVPPEQRGQKPRPDECGSGAGTGPRR
jgi:hypothetical protein